MDLLSDNGLIKKACKGERDAFGELYMKYKDFVYNVAYRFLKDSYKAEDITENVFFALFTNLEQFRKEAKFSTYLYSMTTNMCKNLIREHKTIPITGLESNMQIDNVQKSPEYILATEKTKEMIQNTLDQLHPDYKEILILSDQEELSYDEIANTLGLNKKQIKNRLHRARKSFKERFSYETS